MAPDYPSGTADGDLFAAGGEAGRLMAAFDWASTPVGPVELRVFSVTAGRTTALPAPLTLVAPGERSAGWHRGATAQDTWLLT